MLDIVSDLKTVGIIIRMGTKGEVRGRDAEHCGRREFEELVANPSTWVSQQ